MTKIDWKMMGVIIFLSLPALVLGTAFFFGGVSFGWVSAIGLLLMGVTIGIVYAAGFLYVSHLDRQRRSTKVVLYWDGLPEHMNPKPSVKFKSDYWHSIPLVEKE